MAHYYIIFNTYNQYDFDAILSAMTMLNHTVLMSDANHFSDSAAINPYMDAKLTIDTSRANTELQAIEAALTSSGVKVIQAPSPAGCQDGVYTANWGLCREDTVVLSSLPNKRKDEEPHAARILQEQGKKLVRVPSGLRFSGQGDALPCNNLLFAGSQYRTDEAVHTFLAATLGYEVISLQTTPLLDTHGHPVINPITGWPDSFFYDIDLALAILRNDLIAWCPAAFTAESQEKLRALSIEKIEVSYEEATQGFACNLVTTGETVIMSAHAPVLQAAVEAKGLRTITPEITELAKGGGYIRCTTLSL